MDEQLLLTATVLRLNAALQKATPAARVVILKNQVTGRHLTVSDRQWETLRNFLNPLTVPDVLRVMLLKRTCLPLKEYYELVLKAYQSGVLVPEGRETGEPAEVGQWWGFPGWVYVFPAWTAVLVALLWLGLNPFPWPRDWEANWVDVVAGAGAASLAVTLGEMLAAMALVKAKATAGRLYWRWRSLLPRVSVDLSDQVMLRPREQVGVSSARILPLAFLNVGLGVVNPYAGLVPMLALILELRPFGRGSLMPVLSALFRGHVLDTTHGPLFSANRRWWVRMKLGLSRVTPGYLLIRLLVGVTWTFFLFTVLLRVLGDEAFQLLTDLSYWQEVATYFVLVLGVVLVLVLVPPTFRRSRSQFKGWVRRGVVVLRRWLADKDEYGTPALILHTMGKSQVFRRMPHSERMTLIAGGTVVRYRPGKRMDSAEGSLVVGLILSGKVGVDRYTSGGRLQRVAEYVEGEVLGSEPYVDGEGGATRCRMLTPVIVLVWPKELFERKVLDFLGPTMATDLMVKAPFLRNLPLCQGWHPQALARFAQIARLAWFEPGARILSEGDTVLWMFFIYTGQVLTKKRRVRKAVLRSGQYFGEISLMRQDVASADVQAVVATRCILVHRPEFMRFMTHNPMVALELERVSSLRFGRPVFPYKH